MGQVSAKFRRAEGGQLTFWCPGCEEAHSVRVEGDGAWGFNGNLEAPTFTPSVLVTSGHYLHGGEKRECWCNYEERYGEKPSFKCVRCHSFITDGKIQYLGDCAHALANQTVDLPDLPEHMRDAA